MQIGILCWRYSTRHSRLTECPISFVICVTFLFAVSSLLRAKRGSNVYSLLYSREYCKDFKIA